MNLAAIIRTRASRTLVEVFALSVQKKRRRSEHDDLEAFPMCESRRQPLNHQAA